MASHTIRRRRGKPPLPRLQLTTRFIDCLSTCHVPGWQLALLGGRTHYTSFSAYLRTRDAIPADPVTVARFHRLADALNFPREQVFREVAQ